MNQSQSSLVLSKLKQVTIICTVFIVLQIIGGILSHSIAIISDAIHLFSDVIAFILSAFAVWLSTQKPPSWLAFGYHKIQPLGAFLNVIIIYIVTAFLFVEATERIINKEMVENPLYMLITAVFGLICNLVMMKILHSGDIPGHQCCGHDHGSGNEHKQVKSLGAKINQQSHEHEHHQHQHGCQHEHGHSDMDTNTSNLAFNMLHTHDDTCSHHHDHDSIHPHQLSPSPLPTSTPNIHQNLNIQAAYVHILGDIILSIGVAIASLLIYFFSPTPSAPPSPTEPPVYNYIHLADPICTYLFSILVLIVTLPVLKQSVVVLLDGSLNSNMVFEIKKELENLKIGKYSDVRVWSVSQKEHIGTFRLESFEGVDVNGIKQVFAKKGIKMFIEV